MIDYEIADLACHIEHKEATEKVEEQFSNYCGAKYAITTTSGTAAQHLALKAIGAQERDELIIPDFTMIAILFAVLYCGANPVFVDVEPDTWNIDTDKLEEKIAPKAKIILIIHTYGHPVDMSPVIKLAEKYNLYIIEDATESHGAKYIGKKCGIVGHIKNIL